MEPARKAAEDQAARWGTAGHAWAEQQGLLDEMFRPVDELLLEGLDVPPGGRVLDVGCGTGGTTLAVARRLGGGVRCDGIDISDPMVSAARARMEQAGVKAEFVRADAETHPFGAAVFDAIISRFGVMFFGDFVRAFTNLRRAAKAGGELRFVAWRGAGENPFMTTAERAAAPLLPDIPERDPDAPGQFAFADEAKVRRILAESGWAETSTRAVDVSCSFPATALTRYFTRFGPVGMVLPGADEGTRVRVIETVRAAFDPFVAGADVRFSAALWMVRAQAS